MLKITPNFLQAKFSSDAKIIRNLDLKHSLSRSFPGIVFNHQLELIQGFGSLITDFLFCNTPRIKKNKRPMDLIQGSLGAKDVGLVADDFGLVAVVCSFIIYRAKSLKFLYYSLECTYNRNRFLIGDPKKKM